MPRQRRFGWWIGLSLATTTMLAAALFVHVRLGLTPEERAIVGSWDYSVDGLSGASVGVEYRSDHRTTGSFYGGVPVGEWDVWSVWNGRLYMDSARSDTWLRVWNRIVGREPPGQSYTIVSVTESTIVLDDHHNPVTLVRVKGSDSTK